MAVCKYSQFLCYSNDEAFDQIHEPGANTPMCGIYRCEGCGREITSIRSRPLPPHNHHPHRASHGKICWRLIAGHYSPDDMTNP